MMPGPLPFCLAKIGQLKDIVLVNGKTVSKNYKLLPGDEVHLMIPELKPLDVLPEPIPLEYYLRGHATFWCE
jgi:23S rRNA-/tRNA-specific pseudouridylate synthase